MGSLFTLFTGQKQGKTISYTQGNLYYPGQIQHEKQTTKCDATGDAKGKNRYQKAQSDGNK